MTQDALARDRIDELLAFLPRFETPDRTYVKSWAGGEKGAGGTITLPYPIYEEDVSQFFRLASQSWWAHRDYQPRQAREMLEDDEFIETCTLDDVRTMLTYCVRGERFSDGHWEHVLRTGRVLALLRRLAVLRGDPAPGLEEDGWERQGQDADQVS